MHATNLGRYRLLEEIGSGGMGTVYRAEITAPSAELEAGHIVAIKVVHPHLLAQDGYLQRFLREADIGQRIDHPNVVRTYEVARADTDEGMCHFLAMEHVEGQTLRQLLDEMTRVPEALCRHIGREISRALVAIHGAGVVHRDLKPENVLITPQDTVKVMDLGVARLADAAVRISQTGVFLGSLEYAAPEQIRGQEDDLDGRADLHALGVMLYELATAVHPYRADHVPAVMRRILEDLPRRCGEVNPQISAFYEGLVHALLEKNPAERIATAGEVVSILSEGESGPWWVRWAKAERKRTRHPLRQIRLPRETDLYGRDGELATLHRLFDEARAGSGRVLLLQGEPGVGKTRLLDEFVAALREGGEQPHVLYGAYPPGGASNADGALSAAFREHFGTEELERRLASHLEATPSLVPSFAALLRGDAPPPDTPALTDESLRTLFVQATRSLAAEQPTILLIDDIHRATANSVGLLASLAYAVADHRILLVATHEEGIRDAWQGELSRKAHVETLVVPRLGAKALTQLLFEAIGSERLAHELAGHIALKTDGNPFFVFEVIQMLREDGTLKRVSDGSWTIDGTIDEIPIPSSVADLVQARIGRLEAGDRDLLEVAACLGVEFDPLLVGRVLEQEPLATLRRFAQIEREHRVVRSKGRGMVFDHPSVQGALYERLFEPLREQYHAMIADTLHADPAAVTKCVDDRSGQRAAEIFEHAIRGGRGALALEHKDVATEHLMAGHRWGTSVELLELCLAQPGLLEGEARFSTLLQLASGMAFLGRTERRHQSIQEALKLARALDDPLLEHRAQGAYGLYLWRVGRMDDAERALRRSLEMSVEFGWRKAVVADRARLALVLHALGRSDEAEEHLLVDLAHQRETDNWEGIASALNNLGMIARARADYTRARELFTEAHRHAVKAGHLLWQANAASNLGAVCYALGEWDRAYEHAETHRDLTRQMGHRRGEGVAQASLGLLATARGRYAESLEHQRDALRLFREIGDESAAVLALGNVGLIEQGLGRHEEALATFGEQLDLARRTRDVHGEITAPYHRGTVLFTLGRETEAVSSMEEALLAAREAGRRRHEAECLLELGKMSLSLGKVDEATQSLGEAVELATELGVASVEALGSLLLAKHAATDSATATALARHKMDQLERHEQLEAHSLLHELTGDGEHLGRAKSILQALCAGAPATDRTVMLERVPLYRAIHQA